MTQVLFFPENKLGVSISPIFNGHAAVVSQTTDTLQEDRSRLAEVELMRHNIQGTAFVYITDPSDLVSSVARTGRISFGLYFATDHWHNPVTGTNEIIPDYYGTQWTSAGVSAFANASLGVPKGARYPNHGQELFSVSAGAYGYDFTSLAFGASGGVELSEWVGAQTEYLKSAFGLTDVSALSYRNGETGAARLLMPAMIGGRTSGYSFAGDSLLSYGMDLTHQSLILRPSSTRTLDAGNSNFPNHADSIAYTRTQIQRAIDTGGWWSDFFHWHNAYRDDQKWFFSDFYSAINEQIGSQDVWRAGYNEALEYLVLRASIDKVGSFFDGDKLRIALRFKDAFSGGVFQGLPTDMPVLLTSTPLSLVVNLTGTPLAGQLIKCERAHSIRNLGANQWVINFNIKSLSDGYSALEVTAGGDSDEYFNSAIPALSYGAGMIESDQPCKFVVWRSQAGSDPVAVYRSDTFSVSAPFVLDAGYDYSIGGITRHRMSSVIDI